MPLERQLGELGVLGALPGDTALGWGLVLVLGLMMNRVHEQRGAESTKGRLQRGNHVWGLEENICPILL